MIDSKHNNSTKKRMTDPTFNKAKSTRTSQTGAIKNYLGAEVDIVMVWALFQSTIFSSTELVCCKNRNRVDFDYLRENAIQVAKELQSLKNAQEYDNEASITNIELGRKAAVATLDVVFRKRFLAIQRQTDKSLWKTSVAKDGRKTSKKSRNMAAASKKVSTDPQSRPHVVQVFHLNRNDNSNGEVDERGSAKSTTSFWAFYL